MFRINGGVPFSVHYTSKISCSQNMDLSESAKLSIAISNGLFVKAFDGSRIAIGEGTIIANNVTIHTGNHGLLDRSTHTLNDIKIGKNCWIASGATILGGVELGDNVTVGANSLVNKSFPSNTVVGGVPAIVIKRLN